MLFVDCDNAAQVGSYTYTYTCTLVYVNDDDDDLKCVRFSFKDHLGATTF